MSERSDSEQYDEDAMLNATGTEIEQHVLDVFSPAHGNENDDDDSNLNETVEIEHHVVDILVKDSPQKGSEHNEDEGKLDGIGETEHVSDVFEHNEDEGKLDGIDEIVEASDVSDHVSPKNGSEHNEDEGKPKETADIEHTVSPKNGSEVYDDHGKLKRTAVIGTGVLSLAWAMTQLGWVAGPFMLLFFSCVTYYTSALLADCYRADDSDNGQGSFSYLDAVRANLGGFKVKICEAVQYTYVFGVAVSYIAASSGSLMAIGVSNCLHSKGDDSSCNVSSTPYVIAVGVVQIVLSQIPGFDEISWLPSLTAFLSFTYTTIGLGLAIAKVVENRKLNGSLTGMSIGGDVTEMEKIWGIFQAIGAIAFAYSYSIVLVEIKDTKNSRPSENNKRIKRATLISMAVNTILYMLCGCFGYAAFGDLSPVNVLTGFAPYKNPYWLINIANAAIGVHLIIACQVNSRSLFALVEQKMAAFFPPDMTVLMPGFEFRLVWRTFLVLIPGFKFRLVWRTFFVIVTTVIAKFMPYLSAIIGILGALRFWPLTIYFPVEIYITQKKIARWNSRWVCLKILSGFCLVVSIAAGIGSVAGLIILSRT